MKEGASLSLLLLPIAVSAHGMALTEEELEVLFAELLSVLQQSSDNTAVLSPGD